MRLSKPARVMLGVMVVMVPTTHSAAAAPDVPPDYAVLPPVDGIAPVDRGRLERRVMQAWKDPGLGTDKSVAIDAFASPAQPELARDAGVALMPASTTKLLTAVAVLSALDPQTRFTTAVTRAGRKVFLIGGGDPQLTTQPTRQTVNAAASLPRLARLTADALKADGREVVRLRYDASLFDPPAEQSFWKRDYLSGGVVAPITALSTDGGRANPPGTPRSSDPPLTTATQFAALLEQRGIAVDGPPEPDAASGDQIAAVQSAPLADLVEHMLLVSDNTAAEILAHHAGLELVNDPTFAGGARATLEVLQELGVDTDGLVLDDGSGLARTNRISAEQLLAVLRAAIQTRPERLWPVYTGLPVAGFDGSLAARFGAPAARAGRGAATGKTGTLTGTSTLAGLVTDRDGQLFTYAIMSNRVNQYAAAAAIDRVVARVAGCRCAATGVT